MRGRELNQRFAIGGAFGAVIIAAAMFAAIGGVDNRARAQEQLPALAPDHLRVVWFGDPSTEALISWTTQEPGQQHTVYLAKNSQRDNPSPTWTLQVEAQASGMYEGGGDAHYHHTSLEGLEPSTRYYFVVETDGERSDERWFVTAPSDDRRIKLLYGGDSRSDWEDRQAMNRRLALLLEEDPEILALWHGGDFISDGSDWGDWNQWLTDHALTTTTEGRVLPVIPTRGNHERDGDMYNRVFGWPGGDSEVNYFTIEMGQWAKLITLDSEASVFGAQRDWLETELINAQDSTWIIAGYHTPAWPAVKIPGPARQWVTSFEYYNVDLVCENDGHALKRTVPIRDEKMDPTGVVYVGEGGLGVKQREPNPDNWWVQSPGFTMAAHHVQLLTFDQNSLEYKAIGMDGTVLDTWSREPRNRVLAPFEVLRSPSFDTRGYYLRFNRSVTRDTLTAETVSADPAIPIESISFTADPTLAKLTFGEDPAPGSIYTLDLSEVRDIAGNPLETSTYELLIDGDPVTPPEDMGTPEEDMGSGPEGEDMGDAPQQDMGVTEEQDQGSEPGAKPPADDDEPRCQVVSVTTPSRAPEAPLAVLAFGLVAGWSSRRRRRQS